MGRGTSHPPQFFAFALEFAVAAANWLRYFYLAYASRPKSERTLYRLVKRHRAVRIVEVGVSDIGRTASLIQVAQRFAVSEKVSHTGLDWFDARSKPLAELPLKEAHRILRATGANVRLVPGDPAVSLPTVANAHQNTDFILISHAVADDDLKSAWFYVPRMLHQKSVVLREKRTNSGEPAFEWLSLAQIAEWAGRNGRRRAA